MTDIGVQDRTKEAFQSMAVGELPGLYSLARRLVGDGAEDLVQETLIRAYRSFGAGGRGRGPVAEEHPGERVPG